MKKYKTLFKEDKEELKEKKMLKIKDSLTGGWMLFSLDETEDGEEVLNIEGAKIGPLRTGGFKNPKDFLEKNLAEFLRRISID